ncbi:MAG: hypothetical protein JWR61_2564 [Ferruginibacter sp.]|uniref:hypothetical protein n=1 Tax=Ferruginibacter sp. TaxID=1940288 RepID=UPI0026581964|nr:hypothetical protein [Ferruginibacter sp.]MDB5277609.1 hypothetical protein [Ferruginibacter sp.]
MKNLLLLLLACLIFEKDLAQVKNCKDVNEGVFYSYPKNTSKQYQLNRKDDIQKETDLATGDSSLWKVSWLNDCTYSLTYISGSAKLTEEMKSFSGAHHLVTKIETVTNDFYSYQIFIDKVAGKYLLADTIWTQKKSGPTNNTLFEAIPANVSGKKINFTSKSPFALLYVYRPARFAGSKGEYNLYFDDNIICSSKNGVAYVFKVFKEGNFKLSAKLFNQKETTQNINIKFG